MNVIGVTGPSGSGKNEVCRILQSEGAFIIDADRVGHELLDKNGPVKTSVAQAFPDCVAISGAIDRAKLGARVFAEPRQLELLNRLVHPALRLRVEAHLKKLSPSHPLLVINAALLAELGLLPLCREVWVIDSPEAERLRRLLARGVSLQRARAQMKAQRSADDFRKIDVVFIQNNGSLEDLKQRVLEIFKRLKK
jgi:dephospho-CoA kinase